MCGGDEKFNLCYNMNMRKIIKEGDLVLFGYFSAHVCWERGGDYLV